MPEKAESNKHTRVRYTLIFAILVVIYSVLLCFIAYPYAKTNISNAKIAEHIELYKQSKAKPIPSSIDVCLYNINGPIVVAKEAEPFTHDDLHNVLEALLLPLNDAEIGKGIISYIPSKTKLVGVTNSNGYIFAEFSNDLIFSSDINKAIDQIERTIGLATDFQKISIISDGVIINTTL